MTSLSIGWFKAVKKPVVVDVRMVRAAENGVETLEGYKPCNPEEHYIIRGVDGEEYPIRKSIFDKTYDILRCKDCKKFSQPSWLGDAWLGVCQEGQFGDGQPSDRNELSCELFEPFGVE